MASNGGMVEIYSLNGERLNKFDSGFGDGIEITAGDIDGNGSATEIIVGDAKGTGVRIFDINGNSIKEFQGLDKGNIGSLAFLKGMVEIVEPETEPVVAPVVAPPENPQVVTPPENPPVVTPPENPPVVTPIVTLPENPAVVTPPENPAIVTPPENPPVEPIANVLIGEGTELGENVVIGSRVVFARNELIPAGADLTLALVDDFAEEGVTAVNLNTDVLPANAVSQNPQSPSLLEQVNSLPQLKDNNWQLEQSSANGQI